MTLSKSQYLILPAILLCSAGLWFAIFPPEVPRTFLNQHRAVQSIKTLNLAEHTYAAQHPDTGFVCKLSDLKGQSTGSTTGIGFVDQVLESGTKAAYHFEIGCTQTGIKKTTAYTISALPTKPGTTGVYALCSDQSENIWYSENGSISECFAKQTPIEKEYW